MTRVNWEKLQKQNCLLAWIEVLQVRGVPASAGNRVVNKTWSFNFAAEIHQKKSKKNLYCADGTDGRMDGISKVSFDFSQIQVY